MVTIDVDRLTWKVLNARKEPGDSFDDVIRRALAESQGPGLKDIAPEETDAGGGLLTKQSSPAGEPAATSAGRPSRDDAKAGLDDAHVPGYGADENARREQLLDLWEHLRDNGRATKAEFVELVDPDAVNYASAENFWSNCVKGKDTLRALPGVVAPAQGEKKWLFRGNQGSQTT